MYNGYIQSFNVPSGLVSDDFDVDLPSKPSTRRLSSLPDVSERSFSAFDVDIETFGPALSDRKLVRDARLTNAITRLWSQRLKVHQNPKYPAELTVETRPIQPDTDSPTVLEKENEYQGALQLRLYPVVHDPSISSQELTPPSGKAKAPKLTLDTIRMSPCHYGRSPGMGGASDSSLLGANLSSPATSPSKRLVRFNSCVARGIFEKEGFEEEDTEEEDPEGDSDAGCRTLASKTIEQLPPAMIFPLPNDDERGTTIFFSPLDHMPKLTEDDLLIYQRHPEGIKGLRIRKGVQPPRGSLKRSKSFRAPKYDFISREEIDELYVKKDAKGVDMFGDDAGANCARNSGEIFVRGRRAGRKALTAATVGVSLKDLEWIQVESGKVPINMALENKNIEIATANESQSGELGTSKDAKRAGEILELEEEETETDEEDEDGNLIIHHGGDDTPEVAAVSPAAMLGAAVARGWRAWMM